MRFVAAKIVALASLAGGCSGSSMTASTPPTTPTNVSSTTMRIGHATVHQTPVDQLPLGRPGCSPPSPLGAWDGGNLPETKGSSVQSAPLYGLIMPEAGLPLRVGEQIKIVWRMTGRGPLLATAMSPSGAPTSLTFGPDEHGGSNYQRPGDEWGTGYLFTKPGCWHLHFARDDTQADVWFEIVAT